MSSERPVRVAIIGARGIGRVHARIFQALGANVCAVVGSSAVGKAMVTFWPSSRRYVQEPPLTALMRT